MSSLWCVCVCVCVCVFDLDVAVGSQLVVPQDDLSVLPSSGQQSAAPHLTHTEHTALVTLDLPTDLKRCAHTRTHTHTHTQVSHTCTLLDSVEGGPQVVVWFCILFPFLSLDLNCRLL